MIAGTSIGAFVGALYCEDRDAKKVGHRAREFSMGMATYWDKILDLTYPSTSMFTGEGSVWCWGESRLLELCSGCGVVTML